MRHRLVQPRWTLAVVGSRQQPAWPLVMAAATAVLEMEMRTLRLRISQLDTLQRLLCEWLPACLALGC